MCKVQRIFKKAALEPFARYGEGGKLESGTLLPVLANAYECHAKITCYRAWDLREGVVGSKCFKGM